jgi:A/G-specific adenine glycosylase
VNPDHILQERLLEWYAGNRRSLPWRGSADPYAILVSEFMLQQTGVERVRPVYERFLQTFPTFPALARASRHEVLRAWAGLGYNRRAVSLHECAKVVVGEHGGQLPRDPRELRRLPGVGPYTVAAIQSFVFHEDVAAIDTNVARIVSRVKFGPEPSPRAAANMANALVPPGASPEWNQALMDLGASICTVARPSCCICPLRADCRSAATFEQSPPERKVAERPEPYLGSRRFLRGRIVAFLRDGEPGSLVSVGQVLEALALEASDDNVNVVESLIRALASDGLAHVAEEDGQSFVGPPR